ncbi:tRNA (adenosine(37)-N6)-threonylcarbamoyltransferase complex ATPase subunit type 1 TsaE [Cellulophaga sp. HaHaR_3_176]|uniref:tRNA (adenosine(37)-N6)-threonylcarbamoyltransferase complex ATPase subunit type 1 TsaE n=1 Tax=Cellulophaga sp. HaHaR_3_176 TaxID=1942464 RepID=UPI001C1F5CC1|nr:tRNA (adenosine(37)-N6)-threonylcarbamoyltransferase complex ATPase subunit type 1 TsaE [Cellulophaga sp. HaHaR_3_176]QWX85350.1 tRNA (adenosine(37)-N6)-threonylcarbamoyltransferase complex ATPase subunit type 1 TsaE [Cellulophaga sp. HaHaR_3_176]
MKKEYNITELKQIAEAIIKTVGSKKICFHGDMGAGKTTLIKELVKQLGCTDDVNSPTFGIVNEYHLPDGSLLAYHFDFYRLNDETEALDFGIEDYLYSDSWVLMEWPEKINSLLPDNICNIYIEILDEHNRQITLDL